MDQGTLERDERAHWVAVSQVAGIGPVRQARLFERFGSLVAAWNANQAALRTVLDEQSVRAIQAARQTVEPDAMLSDLEDHEIGVITLRDPHYPRLLSHIHAAPPVLYLRGSLRAEDDQAVAIVGTRKATSYGAAAARDIARGLAESRITVVSGLARGIDGHAHRGALDGGGRTIAVLASGVDRVYPAEHRELTDRIIDSGAVLSEFPPGTRPDAPNFPARNRIISGLSLGTLVAEAPRRSGALITVDFALDQGRDVFALPGNVDSRVSAGTNRLLRDGARAVTSSEDLLEDLGLAPDSQIAAATRPLPETEAERCMLTLLDSDPKHIDELATVADLAIHDAAALLTMMELRGLVRNAGAQHYVLS